MGTINESMRAVRDRLVGRLGGYGRIEWVWLMQKYGVTATDDCPERMRTEALAICEN